ncbi:Fe2+-dependent dioxygenase [Pigmentiphaga sp. GD03639]|uniref:Fe2+-dependent dioxygenase n=1 Tax=Pigmentiphaga daeguensis TaxID=414049 RepID=A0ABN1BG70_9BURK|nr:MULTISPECIES: Fe2+-dependent dioxygenase [unclassified Pigmentiphaga]MDH2237775.1 Fe2+-dependent dioxygenase [Pigmentiphaga sp. GD03639]OVZ65043.1 Fe2+-dependent dioxygenase [Pigmentiphaga sp. NML030171]
MMLTLPDVLTAEQVARCRQALAGASWTDGRTTAGHMAVHAKHNRQLAADDPLGAQLGNLILDALGANPLFISATLPLKVLPPAFNRYEGGGNYGNHIDNAIRSLPGTAHRVRTDISATLFLTPPEDYDGGELVVEDTYGAHRVKLPAGHLVIYPGTSLHRVTPVTRGARVSAFFWVQSLVRDEIRRETLYRMDTAIQQLSREVPGSDALVQLTGIYHNLLRQWSQT